MSHRIAQVESTMKRAIAQVLQRQISDPRIEGMVSITRVQVSPDMHDAYVYVSVLPAEKQRKTLSGLRHASRHIHSLVKKAVAIRTVPHLDFRLDDSIKKQADIYGAIRRGVERTGEVEPDEAEDAPAAPDVDGEGDAASAERDD